ncbi:MAG: hypothetical protein HRF50_00550 [Phycisphaerae bacterium]|jgi:hypothetical protein
MRMVRLSKWVAAIASGAVLLQTTACTEVASAITAIATTVSAGGVIYIVSRIVNN